MNWYPFDKGKSLGQQGSEGGLILRDDKHSGGARITLERETRHAFAITCGIYGWMVHTRFLGEEGEAQTEFESMKIELDQIVARIPLKTDPDVDAKMQAVRELISEFVKKFP